ncbi:MAG: 12,18-didecarboxysiroheme deacetylase [Deltaproteobacteria bacterium]|jgi:12,18-didecarboxysiroheme deacetylase|nr:12,18-didecarboxysiroheme deacetylase [Deltaproteobacteria bacterium]MCL5879974.1 12,18-didecarboxysiroheme deacetylase [Deltaproteobacteria bacterium]MDA8304376.1 12,18-didecarboxysiroheme deacetylase [Deltaproteobacteria bacterium]
MIGISKLYCGGVHASDALRYGRMSSKLPSHLLQFSEDKKPVIVWNMTRTCNLNCIHCYSQSKNLQYNNELTLEEGKAFIDDISAFGSPVMLFSGGEPLMHPHFLDLCFYAKSKGMRAVISTNGTLITKELASELKKVGLSYVGISLDGLEAVHDRFRGKKGAFREALEGINYAKEAGIKVGLRFTVNKRNAQEIPGIFKLLEEENIPRVCFYHLVYAGRGTKLIDEDLSLEETRQTVDTILELTKEIYSRDNSKEVLTVDNHADGPYIYLKLLKEGKREEAENVMNLLKMNGGNSSGVGIGCVSWDGEVYADQFWRHYSFGNIKERKFSEIWTDTSNQLMKQLKNKKAYVKGRCENCKWLDICNGNFRVRSEAKEGDLWAPDPACYLTDEEIYNGK